MSQDQVETQPAVLQQSSALSLVFQPCSTSLLPSPEQRLAYALQLLEQAPKIKQGDRQYTTVATRLTIFRRAFGPLAAVIPDVEHIDNDVVRVRADIHVPVGPVERIHVATGRAEEWRNASDINMTSALENAETSAIGRALAALGLHGGEFASVNEVEGAKAAQEQNKQVQGTEFLTPEEVTDGLAKINAAKSIDELAETFLKFNPALKVACTHAKNVKYRSLAPAQPKSSSTTSSEQPNGSETEKVVSLEAPSQPRAASGRRRGQSNGDA